MKSKPKIRRVILAALLVFATAALGLQPFVTSSLPDCGCQANAAVDVADAPLSCCSLSVDVQVDINKASPCCCNPEASVCTCGDCHCGEAKTPSVPAPAIPTNETTEVVTPTLICTAPLVCYPKQIPIIRTGFPQTVADFAALSSQQTCVLLSRFTC